MPEPAKAAKKPEPTVVPPKEEPAKKGTSSVCAGSFSVSTLCLLLFCSFVLLKSRLCVKIHPLLCDSTSFSSEIVKSCQCLCVKPSSSF